MVSDVSFCSNVNIFNSSSLDVPDKDFLEKITDKGALIKLKQIGGSTNSKYYVFKPFQLDIINSSSGFISPKKLEEIVRENRIQLEKYGYNAYSLNELFPLINETHLEYGKSIWNINDDFFWEQRGIYDTKDNALIGRWVEASKQEGTVEPTGGGSLFTSYIHQEIERASIEKDEYIPVSNDAFELFPELKEPDPYYYLYGDDAGVKPDVLDPIKVKNKLAEAYLKKYTIYNAFETTEQENIIKAPANQNIFVDAGPGTGKTYTLINKINYMVEELDVDPEGIMVLCFTNAAVAEIKKRRDEYVENGGSRGLRKVDIRTFHSFAWWLINEANTELSDKWKPIERQSLSYDGSIVIATRIIDRFAEQVLGGWEHFIVDEIQDLTDVRARLVLQIVAGCLEVGCGLTVLGDSCQSIYDYNQKGEQYQMDSKEFYRSLFLLLYGKTDFYKLKINHRQTQKLISITTGLREAILKEKIVDMKREVCSLRDKMPKLEGRNISETITKNMLDKLLRKGTVCLLCRNNGQVLRLSSQLRKRGINHVINAYDHFGCYASWIAAVFSDFPKEMINYDEFKERYSRCNGVIFNAEEVWDRMTYLLQKEGNRKIGTKEVLSAIYNSQIDDRVFRVFGASNLIVSNIHKAKGREYDTVLVEKNFVNGLINCEKDTGEFKTLYVAVTRPKTELICANLVTNNGIRLFDIWKTGRSRWLKYETGILKYMEIRGNTDIDIESFNSVGENVQDYIRDRIKVGDEVKLIKKQESSGINYLIIHQVNNTDTIIGKCSSMFIADLDILANYQEIRWPIEICDLYVENVYTHFDEQIATDKNEIGTGYVWNWVDFCGLGRVIYDFY